MTLTSENSTDRISQLAQQASNLAERLCKLASGSSLTADDLEEYLLTRERIATLLRAMNNAELSDGPAVR